jgi:arsenical pump membrane protein
VLISEDLALALALVGLALTLAVAVAQPPWVSEAVVAVATSGGLIAVGAVSLDRARDAVSGLGSTVGFLAALLLLADGCRREGLFDALGELMGRGSHDRPKRMLALVFAVSVAVTAVLGLDSTIVLLTPIVFATATRLRMSPKPHVYACSHLANSASLLLPVSNLTNLLAFHASGLSFMHFAILMALPTVAAITVEWVVLTRFFAAELGRPRESEAPEATSTRLPRVPLAVLGATLVGFLLSSALGIGPVWIAVGGAVAITLPALVRSAETPRALVRAIEPPFLVFVLGLGVIVAAASDHGLATAVSTLLPGAATLPDLLLIAVLSAVLANLVNNLPAILILLPAVAPAGHGPVLAALVGVNVGPNLTYVGSLATLLWRRILRAQDTEIDLGEFLRLGALSVPAGLVASTLLLWCSIKAIG